MSGEDLQPGTLVADQYEIERLIGSGGFARVYRARQLELDRPVALKVLAPRRDPNSGSNLETVKKRFYREARLISQLQAPHTVTVYEYDVLDDGKLYMALEYIDGTDLNSLIADEAPLAPARIIRILVQVLKALGAAHHHEILHRDIKPTNVMVYEQFGETDCVKLLDFGIAKSVIAEHQLEAGLTMEGAVIGTPRYMSPEQLQGRPLTPASDLFSAGLLLYEMYTGESPFETHDVNVIYRQMKQMPEDLGPLEEAPPPLADVARKLLTLSIEDRYDGAEAVLEDLRERRPNHRAGSPEVLDDVATGDDSAASVPEPDTPAANESDAISFPLGLDRAGATSSTEMTSVSAGGRTTVAMTTPPSQNPSTPEWNASMKAESTNRRTSESEPGSNGPPKRRPVDPPNGDSERQVETGLTAARPDAPPTRESREETVRETPNRSNTAPSEPTGEVESRLAWIAAIVVGLGLVAGLWYALGADGDPSSTNTDDRAPGSTIEDRESTETPSTATPVDPADRERARERAADHLKRAIDEGHDRAAGAADESEAKAPSSDDGSESGSPASRDDSSANSDARHRDRRPARQPTRSDEPDDPTGAPSPWPDESDDEPGTSDGKTNESSDDPGFEVEPLQ